MNTLQVIPFNKHLTPLAWQGLIVDVLPTLKHAPDWVTLYIETTNGIPEIIEANAANLDTEGVKELVRLAIERVTENKDIAVKLSVIPWVGNHNSKKIISVHMIVRVYSDSPTEDLLEVDLNHNSTHDLLAEISGSAT